MLLIQLHVEAESRNWSSIRTFVSISSPSRFIGSILSRARGYECAPRSSISYQRLQQTPWNNSASKIGERTSLKILRVLPRPARRVLHNGKAMQQSHNKGAARRCASRDSTNQNALFVEWFSPPERAIFRGVYGEIFALFQAFVGNFDNIPP